ncbi:hypothetical protein [Massilia sp. TSP1-1-2]|uniref:hypothetical protein n=1 Tax=Massilia sp. TSP1-1-2 TaxID=2804649 RepID=UPI003CED52E4
MRHPADVPPSPLAGSKQALRDSLQELQQELDKLSPTAKKHSAMRNNYERTIRLTQQLLDEHEARELACTSPPPAFGWNFLKLLGISALGGIATLCILWLTQH